MGARRRVVFLLGFITRVFVIVIVIVIIVSIRLGLAPGPFGPPSVGGLATLCVLFGRIGDRGGLVVFTRLFNIIRQQLAELSQLRLALKLVKVLDLGSESKIGLCKLRHGCVFERV